MSGRRVAPEDEEVFSFGGLPFGAQPPDIQMITNGVVSFEPHLPPPRRYDVKFSEVSEVGPPPHVARFEQEFQSAMNSVQARSFSNQTTRSPDPRPRVNPALTPHACVRACVRRACVRACRAVRTCVPCVP